MLNMRMLLVSMVFFLAAGFVGVSPDGGLTLGIEAQAATDVSVSVDVAKGTKGGSGIDDSVKKLKGTLDRVPGDYAWTSGGSGKLSVATGKSASKKVGPYTLEASVLSIDGNKARITATVSGGKSPNKTTSVVSKGGQLVLAVTSADGKTTYVYVVTVSW